MSIRMEELIVKYLTDTLTPDEKARFEAIECSEPTFADEFKRCLAALALTDYSLADAGKNDMLKCRLSEITQG